MANVQEGTQNISIYLHMWQVDRSMVYVCIYIYIHIYVYIYILICICICICMIDVPLNQPTDPVMNWFLYVLICDDNPTDGSIQHSLHTGQVWNGVDRWPLKSLKQCRPGLSQRKRAIFLKGVGDLMSMDLHGVCFYIWLLYYMFFMCCFTLWWSRAFQQRRFGPPSLVFVGTQGWCWSSRLVNLEWFWEIMGNHGKSVYQWSAFKIHRCWSSYAICFLSLLCGVPAQISAYLKRLPSIDPQEHVYDTFNANSETWIIVQRLVQQCETDKKTTGCILWQFWTRTIGKPGTSAIAV